MRYARPRPHNARTTSIDSPIVHLGACRGFADVVRAAPRPRRRSPSGGPTMRISEMKLTPIAVPDPPLRNSWGIHEPVYMRVIIQLKTDNGLVGLGEAPGGGAMASSLEAQRGHIIGMDPWQLEPLRVTVRNARIYSALEEACLDLMGKEVGRPVSDLLGGTVRKKVPWAAYLFYKEAGDDEWGEVLTPEA